MVWGGMGGLAVLEFNSELIIGVVLEALIRYFRGATGRGRKAHKP